MELLGPILRDVSRSFYVSIRLLPRNLRSPVGLAYLLARATDTIADTTGVPTAVRAEGLRQLASAIQEDGDPRVVVDLSRSFSSLQTNESERALIQALPRCFEDLKKLDASDLGDIRDVLARINRGQMLDIERPVISTAEQLDEYTYLVAGCVGEFWTRLGFRHLANFSKVSPEKMSETGRSYGMGLQLINILRDAGADLRNGRSYFPGNELEAAGLAPALILDSPERLLPIFSGWLDRADRGLEAGMEYVAAIDHRRVRGATALPALIGARTIALLRSAGVSALRKKIKVPRSEVRAMIGSVAITLADREALRRMYQRYKK